jgi:hypothetical protein
MISSFVKFCPPDGLAFAAPGRVVAPTSPQAAVAGTFRRGTAMLVIVPLSGCSLNAASARDAHVYAYEPVGM